MLGHGDAESRRCKPYRQILAEVITRVGEHLGCLPTREELDTFSSSIVSWSEFPDSAPELRALKRHLKLAIITNCDDLFAEAGNPCRVQHTRTGVAVLGVALLPLRFDRSAQRLPSSARSSAPSVGTSFARYDRR